MSNESSINFPLLERLTDQLGGNEEMAKSLLIQRGHMREDGTLTEAGNIRSNMTAEDRAYDRLERSGKNPDDYCYDPETNRCIKL